MPERDGLFDTCLEPTVEVRMLLLLTACVVREFTTLHVKAVLEHEEHEFTHTHTHPH